MIQNKDVELIHKILDDYAKNNGIIKGNAAKNAFKRILESCNLCPCPIVKKDSKPSRPKSELK